MRTGLETLKRLYIVRVRVRVCACVWVCVGGCGCGWVWVPVSTSMYTIGLSFTQVGVNVRSVLCSHMVGSECSMSWSVWDTLPLAAVACP